MRFFKKRQKRPILMRKIALLPLLILLFGCGKDDDQNNPYVIENTEINYEPPEPYYDADTRND